MKQYSSHSHRYDRERRWCYASPSLHTLAIAFAIAIVACATIPRQARAQTTSAAPAAQQVCMVKQISEMSQMPIVASAEDVDALEAKGFDVESCDRAFEDLQNVERWRDYVCQIASVPNEKVQLKFEEKWGERPAVLCAMAELFSSPWKRGGQS